MEADFDWCTSFHKKASQSLLFWYIDFAESCFTQKENIKSEKRTLAHKNPYALMRQQ